MNRANSRNGCGHDDSKLNIAVGIVVIIIIIIIIIISQATENQFMRANISKIQHKSRMSLVTTI